MDRICDFAYKGKNIFCMDLSGLQLKDKEIFRECVTLAKQRIASAPPRSLLVITKVTNAGFDSDVARTISSYAQHNTPYVKASAVVGVTGIQKVVLTAIKNLTKREFYLADTYGRGAGMARQTTLTERRSRTSCLDPTGGHRQTGSSDSSRRS